MTEYAFVGDIHGCFNELENVVARARSQTRHLVFLGDYVNRGKHSRQVIDFLVSLQESAEIECAFLRGNHDQAFLDTLDNGEIDVLLRMGGAATIASYVDEPSDDILTQLRRSVPDEHVQFFRSLPMSMSTDRVYASHIPNLGPGEREAAAGKYRIHGHVVQSNGVPTITDTHAFIDTGCGTTPAGSLTCLFWPSLEWIQSEPRQPELPPIRVARHRYP
ncbi:metallophosphoesterase family protein [Amycolatopsis sp. DG1A-15b]|uniref:metallophosphoesterase family protein n=1 Tax=Amycolatopsis sp. DG1A-15b TaxID=3052846 RepID=UPI00255BD805|nr:metallophosphoesterase family protein [Amycolatopsis sp. DG1A-15b]WIX92467.1 metallophosphoesterase family protein [Amycolatopsis sp. DG1A-15b]